MGCEDVSRFIFVYVTLNFLLKFSNAIKNSSGMEDVDVGSILIWLESE